MTKIKVCGLKNEAQAVLAAEAGADFIGLVMAPSPRQVSPEVAAEITAAIKKLGRKVMTVGVFVNSTIDAVERLSHCCDFDWVQLSGDEPWEYAARLRKPIIKVVRLGQSRPPAQVIKEIDYGMKVLRGKELIILLDRYDENLYGGTGKTFDWGLAVPIARCFPVIVAGGLTSENVSELIKKVTPWGVDISSGVESGGVKDAAKIKKFIEVVRQTDATS